MLRNTTLFSWTGFAACGVAPKSCAMLTRAYCAPDWVVLAPFYAFPTATKSTRGSLEA